jgi:anti-sigma-K factor RskA
MSDQRPTDAIETFDDLAAEYVLGVLGADERSLAADRLRVDPAFRAQVEAWEMRLAPLADEVATVTPPPGVWRRIAASVNLAANTASLSARPKLLDRVDVWRGAAMVLFAVAASLAIVVLRPSQPPLTAPPPQQELVATLKTPQGKVLFVATVNQARSGVTVVPTASIDHGDRSPELWIIPVGGKPNPVGMLSKDRAGSLAAAILSSNARPHAMFAVSLEPIGGSPSGAPTGPVIAIGEMSAL